MRRLPVLPLLLAISIAACGPSKMDPETIAYAKSIVFKNVRLSAKSDLTGRDTYFLRIDVSNNGQRVIKELDIMMYFFDPQGKIVYSERATAVSPRRRPLNPGETRDFQHGFDLPAEWNRVSPTITITYLQLK